jgi:hypothetical protein
VVLSLAKLGRRVQATFDLAQRDALVGREASACGLSATDWAELCAANVDLAQLRTIHRMVSGHDAKVRRADRDGEWTLSSARAGHLRSQPQSFRAGDVMLPAWDHATLARRTSDVIAAAKVRAATEPADALATLVWTLVRAQPFAGRNEQAALVLAMRLAHDLALPVASVEACELDPVFARTLAAPEPDELAAYLTRVLWDDGLAFAEALSLGEAPTRTLAEEHAALSAARARVHAIPGGELAGFAASAVAATTAALVPLFGEVAAQPVVIEGHAGRLAVALASAARGRVLSPHLPISAWRWALDEASGLEALLVVGSPGRGLSGATSVHLSLGGMPAPGLLLVPDEDAAARVERFARWIGEALVRALDASPLRV